MALTLPSPTELTEYINGVGATDAIQWAADLFFLATRLSEQPTDPFEVRLVRMAILEMAWFITEDHENREAEFSPFSSERIGSYSYTKSLKKITDGELTGLRAFDLAVAFFAARVIGAVTIDTEWVFKQGYDADPHDEVVVIPYVVESGSLSIGSDGLPILEIVP